MNSNRIIITDSDRQTFGAQSGSKFQSYQAIGYIDKDFDLGVISEDGVPDHWIAYFTLKTFADDGAMVRVNCRVVDSLAFTMQRELQGNDRVFITGYAVHAYDPKIQTLANKIHITNYAFIDDIKGEEAPYSEEKARWMKYCEKLFDASAPLPTLKDAELARANWLHKKGYKPKKEE